MIQLGKLVLYLLKWTWYK